LGAPERYVDILDKLPSSGAIPADLAKRLVPVFGMRNVLVHEYVRHDQERIWAAVEDPSTIIELVKCFADRLQTVT
jgi:uncharacterized protein YutE (UPF0331/DUF86 family)